jgi:hypothetical protein
MSKSLAEQRALNRVTLRHDPPVVRLAFLDVASCREAVQRGLNLVSRDHRPQRQMYPDLLRSVEVVLLKKRAEYARLDAL